ncbi:DUF6124 family protein [Pseudomonas fluorescens]|uniref:DUF6124 family protein n=1 Tax=Pseudomonas fluorescens TaxID=294 RepID=UPI001BEAC013|nr:DUF3077 domain-containing protein [Pseudomonas fluorescens]MBT2371507.1 DUF3077 domain-containing protein [Pseudomonas fluorescens]
MVKVTPAPPFAFFIPHPELSFEDALAHASALLNCAVACESADQLSGSSRAAMHLVEMAKVMVDRSLDCLHPQ